MRASLTLDDFYEVLTFTRRAGLAAPRGGDAGPLAPAFTALAMIEQAALERGDADCSQIGVASRELCALIIQRSIPAGTAPLESPDDLERLRPLFEGQMR
ncbi:MAG: hypothetical protein NBV68_04940 [Erythrobacter sp.]|uniref:hypothetical protein n=1 Tax=Erythrobacter sp. TaxID=1042 RepID=UPI0025F49144|nr:hypothetical protein [Erythrobacter sp.]MCL9998703.1 hypothetical protein [Erythrobacter sp.]